MSDDSGSNVGISQDVTMEALSLLTSVILLSKVLKELGLYCDAEGNIRTATQNQAVDPAARRSDSTRNFDSSFLGATAGTQSQDMHAASTSNPSNNPMQAIVALLGQQLQTQTQVQAPPPSQSVITNGSSNAGSSQNNFSLGSTIAAMIANSTSSSSDASQLASIAQSSTAASASQAQHNEFSTTTASGKRARPARNNRREYRHESFPEKLHRLVTELEQEGREEIISFVGDNEAGFYLTRPDLFEQEIMGKYFRGRKLTTFRRQLVFYGFFRQRKGRNQGAFVNPHFIRGKPELLKNIVRDDRYDDACGSNSKQDG